MVSNTATVQASQALNTATRAVGKPRTHWFNRLMLGEEAGTLHKDVFRKLNVTEAVDHTFERAFNSSWFHPLKFLERVHPVFGKVALPFPGWLGMDLLFSLGDVHKLWTQDKGSFGSKIQHSANIIFRAGFRSLVGVAGLGAVSMLAGPAGLLGFVAENLGYAAFSWLAGKFLPEDTKLAEIKKREQAKAQQAEGSTQSETASVDSSPSDQDNQPMAHIQAAAVKGALESANSPTADELIAKAMQQSSVSAMPK